MSKTPSRSCSYAPGRTGRPIPPPNRNGRFSSPPCATSALTCCASASSGGVFIDDCPAPAEPPVLAINPVESADITDAVRRQALAHLSGMTLKVFELYTFEELDYTEIAQRLAITPETARTHLCRARKTMRALCASILKMRVRDNTSKIS